MNLADNGIRDRLRDATIQPHGYLVSCTLPGWTVRHVSANVAALLDLAPDEILGRSLREHVGDEVLQPLQDVLELLEPDAPPQRAAEGNIGAMAHLCDFVVHVSDGLVHIELEPSQGLHASHPPTVVAQRMIARVGASHDMERFHQRTAEEIRELTGYDRVTVHRFGDDDAGEVIAEARAGDMPSCLGQRTVEFPVPARAPFLRNRVHVIPDVSCVPVPIVPGVDARGAPLDPGPLMLRSVPDARLAQLQRMGVAASMTVAIVVDDRVWGLVECHHREPRAVPAAERAAADMFGLFVSMRVAAARLEAELDHLMQGNTVG